MRKCRAAAKQGRFSSVNVYENKIVAVRAKGFLLVLNYDFSPVRNKGKAECTEDLFGWYYRVKSVPGQAPRGLCPRLARQGREDHLHLHQGGIEIAQNGLLTEEYTVLASVLREAFDTAGFVKISRSRSRTTALP